jgi:hypothetical protein
MASYPSRPLQATSARSSTPLPRTRARATPRRPCPSNGADKSAESRTLPVQWSPCLALVRSLVRSTQPGCRSGNWSYRRYTRPAVTWRERGLLTRCNLPLPEWRCRTSRTGSGGSGLARKRWQTPSEGRARRRTLRRCPGPWSQRTGYQRARRRVGGGEPDPGLLSGFRISRAPPHTPPYSAISETTSNCTFVQRRHRKRY